jgi:hypothetical protein
MLMSMAAKAWSAKAWIVKTWIVKAWRRIAVIGGLSLSGLAVIGAPGHADPVVDSARARLIDVLPPQPGAKACYSRAYDTAHLRAHPNQRVTRVTFLLCVKAYDRPTADAQRFEDKVYYQFALSVQRRGEKGILRTAGDCLQNEKTGCVVDCDGGGVTLEKAPQADAILLRLMAPDGIRMFGDCDDDHGVMVKPGTDDKVFRVDKTADAACRALETRELGD